MSGVKEIKKKALDLVKEAQIPAAARAKLALALAAELEKLADRPVKKKGGKTSQAWKDLERLAAEKLRGKRLSRGDNFARKDVDVIAEFRALRIDGKYRRAHAHHTFMAEIERKYCVKPGDVPVLVTKHPGQQGAYVTVPLDHYALLLDAARTFWKGTSAEILETTEVGIRALRHQPFKVKDVDDDR